MAGIIWNAIIDHIPVWGWIVIIGLPTAAAFYYLSPILIPIWRMLPTPVKVVLGGIVAGFLAYMGGRNRGAHDKEEEQRRRDAEALQKRTEVDREIGSLSNDEAQKRLRDRWGGPSS